MFQVSSLTPASGRWLAANSNFIIHIERYPLVVGESVKLIGDDGEVVVSDGEVVVSGVEVVVSDKEFYLGERTYLLDNLDYEDIQEFKKKYKLV